MNCSNRPAHKCEMNVKLYPLKIDVGKKRWKQTCTQVWNECETARNELIKLPVLIIFEIKCKAMMGICIYWISRHVIFGKRCKSNLMPWGVGNILQSLNAWWFNIEQHIGVCS